MSGLGRSLRRARGIYESGGLVEVVKRTLSALYCRVWPYLPEGNRSLRLNGVETGHRKRILDPLLPGFITSRTPASPDQPLYEAALLGSLREQVDTGDDVVIVGGGRGISAVVAAERVGPEGSVTVYEASNKMVEEISWTIIANGYERRVTVHHGVVGTYHSHNEDIYGSAEETDRIEIASLPECDLLELDCEGAEVEILSQLEIEPEVIIVETHGFLGASEEDVRNELDRLGYEVRTRGMESESQGVYVLTAVRS